MSNPTPKTENSLVQPVPQPGIMDIAPYVPGEASLSGTSGPAAGLKVLQLAANEGALGAGPKARAALTGALENIHRYPDPGCRALKAKLSERFGFPVQNLMTGAGSDELISLLVQAYAGAGEEVLYSEHGFLMYKLSAMAAGATPVAAPEVGLRTSLQAMLGHVCAQTRLVFVANPNNPTGSYMTKEELHELHAGLPGNVILAVDAAYSEFADQTADYSDGSELVTAGHQNVVMLRTFSKIHGLASLRVGWGYAPEGVIDVINRVRGPFNVSAAAQAAAVAALDDEAHVQASVDLVTAVRPWFAEQMEQLGFAVPPSLGNFVLVKFGAGKMDAIEAHLKSRGIIARRVDAYGLADYLRISLGTRADMERVVDAVTEAAGA